jgi:hypothetical protein
MVPARALSINSRSHTQLSHTAPTERPPAQDTPLPPSPSTRVFRTEALPALKPHLSPDL